MPSAAVADPFDPLAVEGEHILDRADFDLYLSVTEAGIGTSREQTFVHEVVEAIMEVQTHTGDLETPDERSVSWYAAHEEGMRGENEFRGDLGIPGWIIAATMSLRTGRVIEAYIDGPYIDLPIWPFLSE